ncbi:MAG: hypothetical protein AAB400_04340 [Patescibacteria group bacterium]
MVRFQRVTGALLNRALVGITGAAASFPGAALAADFGLTQTAGEAGYNTALKLSPYVGNLINGALGVLGVIFFILMFYGGMLWLTSEGEQDKIKKARGFIFHSILGLIITLFSFGITQFVVWLLTKGTGVLK